jgi:hypothetical protein
LKKLLLKVQSAFQLFATYLWRKARQMVVLLLLLLLLLPVFPPLPVLLTALPISLPSLERSG